MGIKGKRKYEVNDHIFDIIDTEEKAYWLGFLYADGCNTVDKYGCQRIIFALSEPDIYAIQRFKQFTQFVGPIQLYEEKKSKHKKCLIKINSTHMSNILKSIGCGYNKTKNIQFPTFLRDSLVRHFIRGYFDGDGSVGIYKRHNRTTKQAWVQIVGTKDFCESLKNIVNNLGINCSVNNLANTRCVKSLVIGSNSGVLAFLNWIYNECTIYLPRKYDKYLEVKLLKRRGNRNVRISEKI